MAAVAPVNQSFQDLLDFTTISDPAILPTVKGFILSAVEMIRAYKDTHRPPLPGPGILVVRLPNAPFYDKSELERIWKIADAALTALFPVKGEAAKMHFALGVMEEFAPSLDNIRPGLREGHFYPEANFFGNKVGRRMV